MAIKHTPPNGPSIIHSEKTGNRTGCGIDTNVHPEHWKHTHEKITCDKNGCK